MVKPFLVPRYLMSNKDNTTIIDWCDRCCATTIYHFNWNHDVRQYCCKQCLKPREYKKKD